MWAFKRRLNILLLILAFIVCFGVVPYVITHIEQPSCFDKKQNQGEVGVDCGGPCAVICKGGAQDLKVLWKKVSEIRPGVFEAAFFIENPNFNVGASAVPYTVTAYSDSGALITTRQGSTYAGSNENFLVYEGNIRSASEPVSRAELAFGEFPWVSTKDQDDPFRIGDPHLSDLDTRPRLTALIKNESVFDKENIEVAAVVSDDNGNVVGFGRTFVDQLAGGEGKQVTFSWTVPFSYQAALDTCDHSIDTVLLIDRSGSMQSQGKNPPEPFTTVKNSAAGFISSIRPIDQISIVSFSTEASRPIDQPLTTAKDKAKNKMLGIGIGTDGIQYTNTGGALFSALQELTSLRRNPDASRAVILLTDGEANEPNRPEKEGDPEYPKTYALEMAEKAKNEGIGLYTIGLGVNANEEFLRAISTSPDHYYASPSAKDLAGIYQTIGTTLCKKAPSVIEIFPRVNQMKG